MSTNHTPNYQLSQWELTDKVRMDDFNADNAKIDAALGALKSRVDGKADASSLHSRNCQVVTTSYTGTGAAGPDTPNHLSFTRRPLFVHVGGATGAGLSVACGQTKVSCYANGGSRFVSVSWSGNSVSWFEMNNGYAASPAHQLNESGQLYYVFAVLSL